MKEEQKKQPENIMFVKKWHDLLPQMIFRTVQQLLEREEVNELSFKLSDVALWLTRLEPRQGKH